MKPCLLLLIICVFGCAQVAKQPDVVITTEINESDSIIIVDEHVDSVTEQKVLEPAYTAYENGLLNNGFVDVADIEHILVELPYTTANNFTGEILYDSLQHAFLRQPAFQKLKEAQRLLESKDSSYTLIVFDALRPNAAQHKMWEIVKGTNKERYVADPWAGSVHNYGLAVDCSIYDLSTDSLLNMGTPFDDLSYMAQYRYNEQLVKEGKISKAAKENRELLREVMVAVGFQPINSEWWHFNGLSKEETRRLYRME